MVAEQATARVGGRRAEAVVQVAILMGLQASGKTTFFRQVLAATHAHVSKDAFPNARNRQRRQLRLIGEALAAGRNVAVDNTNPEPADRAAIVAAAREFGASEVVGYWFPPDPAGSLARNATRAAKTRVPDAGLRDTLRRLRPPRPAEGFDALHVVRFDGAGGFVVEPMPRE